jgi:predicted RNA-binding Zn-ribbon protein involved in translation (DUF1610 family)
VFLLFGTRAYLNHLATVSFACPYCGRVAPQEVLEAANRFTLFFLLPLFTLSRDYFNRCTNCGGETPLTAEQARNSQEWAASHPQAGPGR